MLLSAILEQDCKQEVTVTARIILDFVSTVRGSGWVKLVLLSLVLPATAMRATAQAAPQPPAATQPNPTQIATREDHQRMMDLQIGRASCRERV